MREFVKLAGVVALGLAFAAPAAAQQFSATEQSAQSQSTCVAKLAAPAEEKVAAVAYPGSNLMVGDFLGGMYKERETSIVHTTSLGCKDGDVMKRLDFYKSNIGL